AAGAAERHCEALLHEVSAGSKNALDYANHHRPQTSLTVAGLATGGLFIVSRGRVKPVAVSEIIGEVEAAACKTAPAAMEKAAAGAAGAAGP
ncbi:hypothetical protein, partial [Klebsiella pneumoniae]|uniref:hypothetical protein n=1 Tax=Klebsiella pneumoniae TaxID=573 RepID=UPI003B9827A8